MKKWLFFSLTLILLLFTGRVLADDKVKSQIDNFKGNLQINQDNTATYTQEIDYTYKTKFNGQYVTLGEAGVMPANFRIADNPKVQAYKNGKEVHVRVEKIDWDDGTKLKIYNGGHKGDKVKIRVQWQLSNLLTVYQDVAELNWMPLSDQTDTIKHLEFTVKPPSATSISKLYAHTNLFRPQASIQGKDGEYTVKISDVKEKFELHAYWAKYMFYVWPSYSSSEKDNIEALERQIEKESDTTRLNLGSRYPMLITITMAGFGLLFDGLLRLTHRTLNFNKKTYLFNIPESALSPLVAARFIHQQSLFQSKKNKHGLAADINFNNLIQATLLDLIDRRILTVVAPKNQKRLKKNNIDEASASEKEFISFVMGDRKEASINHLFLEYEFNDADIRRLKVKYSGGRLQKEVRELGRNFNTHFNNKLNRIDEGVQTDIKELGLITDFSKSNIVFQIFRYFLYAFSMLGPVLLLGASLWVI